MSDAKRERLTRDEHVRRYIIESDIPALLELRNNIDFALAWRGYTPPAKLGRPRKQKSAPLLEGAPK